MHEEEPQFSLKSFFTPFTTSKAIHFLILIGIIIFANTLFNEFVFDDMGSIVTNPSVHSLSTIPGLFVNQLSGFDANIFYRPLPFILYDIIHSFSGINTFYYHLIQLLFHITNTILILFIFKRFLKLPIAFITSLFYLIHPINQEAVIYISAMHETLFVFFGLSAIYLLQQDNMRTRNVILANIALLFSLFSKETGILFLLIAFLYVFLFKKQKLFTHLISTFAISALYIILRFHANIQQPLVSVVPMMNLPLLERMKSVPAMLLFYIKALLIPVQIADTNSWYIQSVDFNNFYLPLIIDVIFFIAIFWLFIKIAIKNKKLALFFLLWFLSGLLIHMQLIPLDATVASRYFYFSFIGLLGFLGLFVQQLKVSQLIKNIGIYSIVILLSLYAIKILITNNEWQSQYSIVSHDQRFTKNDYLQELLYSSELIKLGKYQDAYPHALKATELYPKSYYAWNNVGVANYYSGHIKEARVAYARSISLANYNGSYDNMALLLIEKDSLLNARAFLRKANPKFPNDEKLWGYRIYTEYKTGDLNNAKYAARYYYLLRRDTKSQYIYNRLQQNLPIDL